MASSGYTGLGNGYAVYDLTRHAWVYRRNPLRPLKPASNMKLTTTAAAFAKIGIGTRLATRVYYTGTRSGSTIAGSLWLVGGGDPSLSTSTYSRNRFAGVSAMIGDLAKAVRAAGIRHVTGALYGDESRFDTVRTGPYWKPAYRIDCSPISALTANEDWTAYGSPYSYSSPALHAATLLRASLATQGVTVAGGARTATKPAGAGAVLATETSPPMYRLALQMNLPSDNVYAEMLNKDIAVASGARGTMANGRVITRGYLAGLGIITTGWRLYDGSGLSPGDRLTAQSLVSILTHSQAQPYGWWLRNSLPIAGVNGTLRTRMRTGPAHGNARAKTGTLGDASALSGYVRSANGHTLVFSILNNHEPTLNITAAHAVQDRIVQALAGSRPS